MRSADFMARSTESSSSSEPSWESSGSALLALEREYFEDLMDFSSSRCYCFFMIKLF